MQALIVDDDAPTVMCIQASIDWENLGIQNVYAAYNQNGATRILAKEKIDIIICDIEMPMGSGLDLLAWIRNNDLGCEFILLTCHDRFDFASTAIEYKAASYLLKPFDPEKMTAELIKATERIEQSRQLHEYSRYGSFWLENRDDVEREFWRELITAKIATQRSAILAAAERRGVTIQIDKPLTLVLFSLQYDANTDTLRTESAQGIWEHRAAKLFAKELLKSNGIARIQTEWHGDRLWMICVLFEEERAFLESERMIDVCKMELHADVSGYYAESVAFEQATVVLRALKKADADNVDRSCMLQRLQPQRKAVSKSVTLDLALFRERLADGNKAQILNYLYVQLEMLAAEQLLTPKTLYTVQQDILQETYAYLH
ncbi:MAG: response regulator, partial [Clostridia bacterium]